MTLMEESYQTEWWNEDLWDTRVITNSTWSPISIFGYSSLANQLLHWHTQRIVYVTPYTVCFLYKDIRLNSKRYVFHLSRNKF